MEEKESIEYIGRTGILTKKEYLRRTREIRKGTSYSEENWNSMLLNKSNQRNKYVGRFPL